MRVIQEGRPKEKQCECPMCSSIIGYYEEEVQKFTKQINGTGYFIDGNIDGNYGELTDYYITCPFCGSYIDLGTEFHLY